MEQLYENIRKLRTEKGISQDELARLTGYKDRSSITKIESGKVDLAQSKIMLFAKVLGTTPADLMGLTTTSNDSLPPEAVKLETKELPILGSVACGKPIFDPSDGVQIKVPSSFHADFGLYARGDSMIGADIHDGDLVFFVQQPSVENGQIAAVFIDDEVTLKRVYYQQGERLVLQAENSSVPPIIIEGPDLNQVHIIGRAIAKQSAVV
ncbi:MAG: S24 family peptidase [Peptococcaceae bacterium]|nr:S24 family peptidase [Peptococcaceae bacterium]